MLKSKKGLHGSLFLIALVGIVYGVRPAYLYFASTNTSQAQHKCLKAGKSDDPSAVQRPNPGIVKTVRLTDLGEFVDRCDFTDAVYELNWDRKLSGDQDFNVVIKPEAVSLPKLVVLYVHGWRHNANSSDHAEFTKLVARVQKANEGTSQVTGIYVSWEAASNIPVWEFLNFWNRMRAADRIAQSAVLTKLTGAIDNILERSHHHPKNQFIAIGHSFGARILYAAVSQTLIYNTQRGHPGGAGGAYRTIAGVADTVILINPAFEASLFTTLNSVLRMEENFAATQPPLLLSISSAGDQATQWAFPIGQWLGWWTAKKELSTLGNYADYITHTLQPKAEGDCPKDALVTEANSYRPYLQGLCLQRKPLASDDPSEEELRAQKPHTPFLVASTNTAVIEDHSKIWEPIFADWLFEFMKDVSRMHEQARGRLAPASLKQQ